MDSQAATTSNNFYSYNSWSVHALGKRGYDKKMLWRANLYIDEGAGVDWNELRPWNAPAVAGAAAPAWWNPAWGVNEWNRSYAFNPVFNENQLVVPAGSLSGTQSIRPFGFTWKNGNDYANIRSVPYSLACHDSPFEYNNKMDHQNTLLNYMFAIHEAPYNLEAENSTAEEPVWVSSEWTDYLAPGNALLNPAPANPLADLPQGNHWQNYVYRDNNIGFELNAEQAAIGGTYFPYRPGYASTNSVNTELNVLSPFIKRSAGVDCVGFVQRSMSYVGETYTLASLPGYTWNTDNPETNRNFPRVEDGDLWGITARDQGQLDIELNQIIFPKLQFIVPGDIIYYLGHVMIIASINNNVPLNMISISDFTLIEATFGNFGQVLGIINYVTNRRTLENINNNGRAWIVGRMR